MRKLVLFLAVLTVFVLIGCGSSRRSDSTSIPTPPPTPTPPPDNSPPYGGTVFINPNIITDADLSTFQSLTETGRGERLMFDRRSNSFNTVQNVFLFDAFYDNGTVVEIQVNPEFATVDAAEEQALLYATAIGRIPDTLFNDLETVWIHRGNELFGGGNNNILIHTEQGQEYIKGGWLEEVLVHESAHTSLDANHAKTQGWIDAQNNDNRFISTYARDNPFREDIAESFLVFLALDYLSYRLTVEQENTIREVMPNRLNYFRQANLDMFPYQQ
jgi:hypothetical protein